MQSPVLRFPGELAFSLLLVTLIFLKKWQEKNLLFKKQFLKFLIK